MSKAPSCQRVGDCMPHLLSVCAALSGFLLDFVSKNWAVRALRFGESRQFMPSFLQFSLVSNTGAAFSLGHAHGTLVLLTATGVLLGLVFWFCLRLKNGFESRLEEVGLAIIIGAAAGNLVDRYKFGFVIDFLEFTFVQFPVFNVADVLIDVGIGLVALSVFRKNLRTREHADK